MLLPITFPIAISGFFFSAATIEVASSGREVPVSYTHLDVYKRQAVGCPFVNVGTAFNGFDVLGCKFQVFHDFIGYQFATVHSFV